MDILVSIKTWWITIDEQLKANNNLYTKKIVFILDRVKYIFFPIFLLLIFFSACHNNNVEKEITNTINAVYKKPNVYDQLGADTTLLSKQLSHLVARAKEVEELDLQRVRNSEYPTDKPLLIEGEIFTSIYEGYSSLKVDEVEVKNKSARAIVSFTNEGYKLNWCDTLLLINENGWKLYDVLYNKDGGSLQKTLTEFNYNYKE